jgi:hypothetical protein
LKTKGQQVTELFLKISVSIFKKELLQDRMLDTKPHQILHIARLEKARKRKGKPDSIGC